MLSSKLQDAFNKQINAELYSSYLYLSMAAYFESKDLKGMAHWMGIQADYDLELARGRNEAKIFRRVHPLKLNELVAA